MDLSTPPRSLPHKLREAAGWVSPKNHPLIMRQLFLEKTFREKSQKPELAERTKKGLCGEEQGGNSVIIRADRAFLEAMQEAGYPINLKILKNIYAAAKVKRRPKPRADNQTIDMFDSI